MARQLVGVLPGRDSRHEHERNNVLGTASSTFIRFVVRNQIIYLDLHGQTFFPGRNNPDLSKWVSSIGETSALFVQMETVRSVLHWDPVYNSE